MRAVFENGVLRPLEPLNLVDNQEVDFRIEKRPQAADTPQNSSAEIFWLRDHWREYIGEWVALDGDRLLSHGKDFRLVLNEARSKGCPDPLMEEIYEGYDQPSAGL